MKVTGIFDQFTRKEILIPEGDGAEWKANDYAIYHDDDNKENIGRVHYAGREVVESHDKLQKNL